MPGGVAGVRPPMAVPYADCFVRVDRAAGSSAGQRLRIAQRRGVHAAIDVHDFTGDAAGEVREQEGGGVADFVDGHVAA